MFWLCLRKIACAFKCTGYFYIRKQIVNYFAESSFPQLKLLSQLQELFFLTAYSLFNIASNLSSGSGL